MHFLVPKNKTSLSYLLAAGRARGGEEILNSGKCWELGQSRHNPGLGRGEHQEQGPEAQNRTYTRCYYVCASLTFKMDTPKVSLFQTRFY